MNMYKEINNIKFGECFQFHLLEGLRLFSSESLLKIGSTECTAINCCKCEIIDYASALRDVVSLKEN